LKLPIIVLLVVIASLGVFIYVMNWLDNIRTISTEEEQFYHSASQNEKNQVFILGSSHVTGINASLVNSLVSEEFPDYEVYNLGKSGDRPNMRVDSIDLIVNAKPEIVVYGLGYRDFNEMSPVNDDAISLDSDIGLLFPNTRQVIETNILLPLDFYKTDYNFLSDPHSSTLRSISSTFTKIKEDGIQSFTSLIHMFLLQEKIEFSLFEEKPNQNNYFQKTPFFFHTSDEYDMITGSASDGLIRGQCDHIDMIGTQAYFKDSNAISLINMVEKLQENDIKVVIFTTPLHQICREKFKAETERLETTLLKISNDHDVPVYFLHDKYDNNVLWYAADHVSINENFTKYSVDIADIIFKTIR
jgi:hypothetical protein